MATDIVDFIFSLCGTNQQIIYIEPSTPEVFNSFINGVYDAKTDKRYRFSSVEGYVYDKDRYDEIKDEMDRGVELYAKLYNKKFHYSNCKGKIVYIEDPSKIDYSNFINILLDSPIFLFNGKYTLNHKLPNECKLVMYPYTKNKNIGIVHKFDLILKDVEHPIIDREVYLLTLINEMIDSLSKSTKISRDDAQHWVLNFCLHQACGILGPVDTSKFLQPTLYKDVLMSGDTIMTQLSRLYTNAYNKMSKKIPQIRLQVSTDIDKIDNGNTRFTVIGDKVKYDLYYNIIDIMKLYNLASIKYGTSPKLAMAYALSCVIRYSTFINTIPHKYPIIESDKYVQLSTNPIYSVSREWYGLMPDIDQLFGSFGSIFTVDRMYKYDIPKYIDAYDTFSIAIVRYIIANRFKDKDMKNTNIVVDKSNINLQYIDRMIMFDKNNSKETNDSYVIYKIM